MRLPFGKKKVRALFALVITLAFGGIAAVSILRSDAAPSPHSAGNQEEGRSEFTGSTPEEATKTCLTVNKGIFIETWMSGVGKDEMMATFFYANDGLGNYWSVSEDGAVEKYVEYGTLKLFPDVQASKFGPGKHCLGIASGKGTFDNGRSWREYKGTTYWNSADMKTIYFVPIYIPNTFYTTTRLAGPHCKEVHSKLENAFKELGMTMSLDPSLCH